MVPKTAGASPSSAAGAAAIAAATAAGSHPLPASGRGKDSAAGSPTTAPGQGGVQPTHALSPSGGRGRSPVGAGTGGGRGSVGENAQLDSKESGSLGGLKGLNPASPRAAGGTYEGPTSVKLPRPGGGSGSGSGVKSEPGIDGGGFSAGKKRSPGSGGAVKSEPGEGPGPGRPKKQKLEAGSSDAEDRKQGGKLARPPARPVGRPRKSTSPRDPSPSGPTRSASAGPDGSDSVPQAAPSPDRAFPGKYLILT